MALILFLMEGDADAVVAENDLHVHDDPANFRLEHAHPLARFL
jgi:hypothetical protein